ncbi:Gfo/Idh/MocA family oxidoreductase [Thermoleptolyngbya sichuanensis XZ-Cy5]|uniref:Gfo/Idh/MocA family protein n=1 Tax=Thermoleptolyngbya sichuanensis TaxID=2885951 RepID=UPI00240D3536|nr:Gfo/Idh/MocA family oxidoreductase [Thermoleptolyngbya sichuanensis XZ-Cy5]
MSNVDAAQDSPSVGIVILGLGRWGMHLLRNFLALPGVRVVAIADPSTTRLQTAVNQLGLAHRTPAVLALTDWAAALDLDGVDAVAIATPASTHAALLRTALNWGLHGFVEKPLALCAAEGRELCQLAAAQGRRLVVDHTYLFHPAVQAGRSLVQRGLLGQVRYGSSSRTHLGPVRSDVDALWDLAIHDIAIFNHWLEERPVQGQAWGTVWLQPALTPQLGAIAQETNQAKPAVQSGGSGVSDLVWARLFYPSGFQATLQVCWLNPDRQRRLSMVGDRASLIFDEMATDSLVLQTGALMKQDRQFLPTTQERRAIAVSREEPLRRACEHFVDCVRGDRPSSLSSGEVGTELITILEALSRSMAQQGAIVPVAD